MMSNVKNDPKYKNALLQAVRAQLDHRALWLYLLCDEAKKRGLDPRDFASDAIKRCGLSQGAELVEKGKTDSLKGLRKTLFTKPAQLVFEMKILESTDDKLSIDFHYCPLVKAWQKAGCSDEEIAMLCDIAMCGDHGIGERYGSVLDLPKCIAKGDDIFFEKYWAPFTADTLHRMYSVTKSFVSIAIGFLIFLFPGNHITENYWYYFFALLI